MPEDIVARVLHDFGEEDGFLILQELKNLQGEDSETFDDRVVRCIVALSKGSIQKFDQQVAGARRDWRDTLVAGEGWAHNALLMTLPFPLHLNEDICRGWFSGRKIQLPWLSGGTALWQIEATDIRKIELRRIAPDIPAESNVSKNRSFRGTVKMLCARGQWVSTSPAFEIWFFVWYAVDLSTNAFTLQRIRYNPNEIKPRGIWDQ